MKTCLRACDRSIADKSRLLFLLTLMLLLFSMSANAIMQSSRNSINFGSVHTSQSTTATITLTPSVQAYLFNIVISHSGAGFSQVNNCDDFLYSGSNCTITVTFNPTSVTDYSGFVTINYYENDFPATPINIPLSGAGVEAQLSVTPPSLTFSDNELNTPSLPQSVIISNTGGSPLMLDSILVNGDFSETNDCPASLDPDQSCTSQVVFSPTATGNRSGSLVVSGTDSLDMTPLGDDVSLNGNGIDVQMSVSPSSLGFSGVAPGHTSEARTVSLTNTGTVPVILDIVVDPPFSLSRNCPQILEVGQTCSVEISYSPTGQGSSVGLLSITGTTANSTVVFSTQAELTGSSMTVTDIQNLLMDYAGDNPNLQSLVQVILDTCPSGRASERLQADCNAVIEAALAGDPNTALALAQVLPERSIKSSRLMQQGGQAQNANIAGRIAALRAGATGVSFGGLSFRINDQTLSAGQLAESLLRDGDSGGSAGSDGGLFDSRLGGFLTGTLVAGDKDGSALDSGLEFKTRGITGGIDYRFSDNLVLGGAIGFMKTDTDLDANGGSVDTKGFNFTAYGTYYTPAGYFLDFSLGYGRNNFDQSRNIGFDLSTQSAVSQQAVADYDGKMLNATLSTGYDFAVDGWTLGPRASLDYVKTSVDGFSETLSSPGSAGGGWATFINETDQKWLTLRVGGKASFAHSTSWGVLTPYIGADWLHEFKNDSQIVTGGLLEDPQSMLFSIQTEEPDRNYFQLNLGVSAVFRNGLIGYLNYDRMLSNANWDRQSVNLGIRAEF